MVIDYLNIFGARCRPAEAYAVLIIHTYAVLPLTVATERLQPIPRRDTEVLERSRNLKLPQLPASYGLYVHEPLDSSTAPKCHRVGALERNDHMKSITRHVNNVKRDYWRILIINGGTATPGSSQPPERTIHENHRVMQLCKRVAKRRDNIIWIG